MSCDFRLWVWIMPKSEILKGWKILGCADAIYKFWLFQVNSRNSQFSKSVGWVYLIYNFE